MGFRASTFAMSDGKIVDAHGADSDSNQVPSGLGWNVHVIGLKLLCPPQPGIRGLEEQAVALAGVMAFQFVDPDEARVVDLDHSGGTDRGIEGQGVDSCALFDEVQRRVHVRSGVGAASDFGKIAGVPIGQGQGFAALERRVAGPVDHSIVQRKRDVDPVAVHEAIVITFFTPPAPLESGSIACSIGKRLVMSERTALGQRLRNTPK